MKTFLQRIFENVIANVVALLVVAAVVWLAVYLGTRNVGLAISVFFNVALLGLCVWLLWKNDKLWERQEAAGAGGQRLREPDSAALPIKTKYDLLPDPKNMIRLNIDDVFLTKLYADVKALVTKWSDDAKLSKFHVQVDPFTYPGLSRISIFLRFFSAWAHQSRSWHFDEYGSIRQPGPPEHPHEYEGVSVFSVLPWEECPDWLETLHKAYTQIAPLPEDPSTGYWLSASAYSDSICKWMATFTDGVSGREYEYNWDKIRGLRRVEW